MQNAIFTGKRVTLLVIFAIIAFSLGSLLGRYHQQPLAQQLHATLLPQPRMLQPFILTNTDNQPFTNQSLQGHWTFLFFGFTNCAYMCPTTMAALKQVYNNLQTHQQTSPQMMFVSLDPQRDTLARIKQYVTGFNPTFQGATGSKAQLDQLTSQLNVLYLKTNQPATSLQNTAGSKNTEGSQNAGAQNVAGSQTAVGSQNKADYQIDHSGTVLLIDPKGELYAVFSMPHDPESISKDFRIIAARSGYSVS